MFLAMYVCGQLLLSRSHVGAVPQCSSSSGSCSTPTFAPSATEQDMEDLLLEASDAEVQMLEVSLLQSISMKPFREQGSATVRQGVRVQDMIEISSNGTSAVENHAEEASSSTKSSIGAALEETSRAGADSLRRVSDSRRRYSSPRRRYSSPPRRRYSSSPRRRAPGTGFQSPRRRSASGAGFSSPRRRSVYGSGGYQRPLGYGGGYGHDYGYEPDYSYGPGYYHHYHDRLGFGDYIIFLVLLCCCGPLVCMFCGCMCIYEALATICPCCFPRPRKQAAPLIAEPELPRQQPHVRATLPPPQLVRRSGLHLSRSSLAGDVDSNGVAIPRDVAQDFLAAVDDEYVKGAGQVVGRFFDVLESSGTSQQIRDELGQEEVLFQNASDRQRVYDDLASRWGIEPGGFVYSDGITIPLVVAEDFLAAVIAEYFKGHEGAVELLFNELNSRGISQQIGNALGQEEQLFQNAGNCFDRRRVYDDLASRWGMEPQGPVYSHGVEIPSEVARDFLQAVYGEYFNGEEGAVERLFDELRSRGVSERIGNVLGDEEQVFQNTGDVGSDSDGLFNFMPFNARLAPKNRKGAYNNLLVRWGM